MGGSFHAAHPPPVYIANLRSPARIQPSPLTLHCRDTPDRRSGDRPHRGGQRSWHPVRGLQQRRSPAPIGPRRSARQQHSPHPPRHRAVRPSRRTTGSEAEPKIRHTPVPVWAAELLGTLRQAEARKEVQAPAGGGDRRVTDLGPPRRRHRETRSGTTLTGDVPPYPPIEPQLGGWRPRARWMLHVGRELDKRGILPRKGPLKQ